MFLGGRIGLTAGDSGITGAMVGVVGYVFSEMSDPRAIAIEGTHADRTLRLVVPWFRNETIGAPAGRATLFGP